MPIPVPVTSIVYVTDHEDDEEFVTFTFTLGVDPLSPRSAPLVTVEIDLSWEVSSPQDPITAELRPKQPAQLSHVSDDGQAIRGTLSLQPTLHGPQLAIFADVTYGVRDDHHLNGVLGTFTPVDG
jgi:hypothetical protein